MTITGALVLYAVLWVLGMLIALPLGLQTQGDTGHQADDTPASTPLNPDLGRKALRVTLVAGAIWAVICVTIWSGLVTMSDIDFWNRM